MNRVFRLEIATRPGFEDPAAGALARAARSRGYPQELGVERVRVAFLRGLRSRDEAETLARELLVDPLVDEWTLDRTIERPGEPVWVLRKPGATEPAEGSAEQAARDLGLGEVEIRLAIRYHLRGQLAPEALESLAREVLANPVVDQVRPGQEPPEPFPIPRLASETCREIPLDGLDAAGLAALSSRMGLALSAGELAAVRDAYAALGRPPRDLELEAVACAWSEHCCHKTFLDPLVVDGEARPEGLFRSTIAAATRAISHPDAISVFKDNAGIVRFAKDPATGRSWCYAAKVETHNHPSALDPYGGAATGLGGVIRDVLAAGQGARPFLGLDVFGVADPDSWGASPPALPPGIHHPAYTLRGVTAGVGDYGNRMGIPTASGALLVDPGFLGIPLVFCGTIGLLQEDQVPKGGRPGDRLVLVGGATGRDGLHGATFSSEALKSASDGERAQVQIGHAIHERQVLEALLACRDRGLIRDTTDLGAGGLAGGATELARSTGGAAVDLDRVPRKEQGMAAWEAMISESQERLLLAVAPGDVDEVRRAFEAEGSTAADIGELRTDGFARVSSGGRELGSIPMRLLYGGRPARTREAIRPAPPAQPDSLPPEPVDLGLAIQEVLADWNVCSREALIRRYDHTVQGGTARGPLTERSPGKHSPTDGAILRPLPELGAGLAVGLGCAWRLGRLDPRQMGIASVDEGLRNAIASGADPSRITLLDNFAWGAVDGPEELGALVACAEGASEAAIVFGAPFVSGKDSLRNTRIEDGRPVSIPGVLLVTAIGVVPEGLNPPAPCLREAGCPIYVVGPTDPSPAGSVRHPDWRGPAPRFDARAAAERYRRVHRAIREGLIAAIHDVSDGGLAAALAELSFGAKLGAEIDLAAVTRTEAGRDELVLFSESPGRFLVALELAAVARFEALFGGDAAQIGVVQDEPVLRIHSDALDPKRAVAEVPVARLYEAWTAPLERVFA